jgi:hypothetical protein
MQQELFATPFEQVQAELEHAMKVADEAKLKASELRKKRNEMCPHLEIEKKSCYFSGSYYDKAYTEYWNQCKCCGAKSEAWTETHNWYG